MFIKILNHIKLAQQTKRKLIKISINKNEMPIFKKLIQLNFIKYIYKPNQIPKNKYNNFYYVCLNTKNNLKIKNLYRPSGIRTISYKELTKTILSKKCMYILTTNKGLITHNKAIKQRIGGIMVAILYI